MLIFLLLLMPLTALAVLFQNKLLNGVIVLGVFSLLSSAVYFLLGAPDVAVTEGAIGVALVTFIYVIALSDQGRLKVIGEEVPRFLFREGGKLKGVDYEILQGFAREQGLELEVELASREQLPYRIAEGEKDFIAGAFYPTPAQEEQFSLSLGYQQGHLVELPLREGSDGERIGIFEGVPVEEIEDNLEDEANFSQYRGVAEMISAYQRGDIDRIVIDHARLGNVMDEIGSEVERGEDFPHLGTIEYVFAIDKEREELHSDFQKYLKQLLEEGELERLIRKYFSQTGI